MRSVLIEVQMSTRLTVNTALKITETWTNSFCIVPDFSGSSHICRCSGSRRTKNFSVRLKCGLQQSRWGLFEAQTIVGNCCRDFMCIVKWKMQLKKRNSKLYSRLLSIFIEIRNTTRSQGSEKFCHKLHRWLIRQKWTCDLGKKTVIIT